MSKKVKYLLLFILTTLLILIGYFSFSDPVRKIPQYQSTHLNDRFNFAGNNFNDYINQTEIMIKNARIKAGAISSSTIVKNNAPFQLLPNPKTCKENSSDHYQNGVLLVHGLGDSPYWMRPLGHFFQSHCFLVRTVLLPGMGTTVGDLKNATYQEWLKAAQYGADSFKGKVNNLYLVGFSTGCLAITQVAPTVPNLKALILFSPAFALKSKHAFLIPSVFLLSHFFPSLKWLSVDKEIDPHYYQSRSTNSVYQIYLLAKKASWTIENKLSDIPLFVVESNEDMTINTENNLKIFSNNHNPHSRFILYTNKKLSLNDTRILLIPSAIPSENILEQSHYSVVLPATDPFYGKNGSVKDCSHYKVNSENRSACEKGKSISKGEITSENLQRGVVQRISYNPFFGDMLNQLNLFIQSLSVHDKN